MDWVFSRSALVTSLQTLASETETLRRNVYEVLRKPLLEGEVWVLKRLRTLFLPFCTAQLELQNSEKGRQIENMSSMFTSGQAALVEKVEALETENLPVSNLS